MSNAPRSQMPAAIAQHLQFLAAPEPARCAQCGRPFTRDATRYTVSGKRGEFCIRCISK